MDAVIIEACSAAEFPDNRRITGKTRPKLRHSARPAREIVRKTGPFLRVGLIAKFEEQGTLIPCSERHQRFAKPAREATLTIGGCYQPAAVEALIVAAHAMSLPTHPPQTLRRGHQVTTGDDFLALP